MHSKEIIKKANDAINKWATSSKKLVVAIDGYSGAGKTTFLNQLAQLPPYGRIVANYNRLQLG